MTWHVARDYCESLGGHLARIESRDEMEFIANFCGNAQNLWLDGTDEIEEGIWMFTNTKPVDQRVLNWHQGNGPRNGNAHHYLRIWEGEIIDSGSERVHFVVEWDK